VLRPWLPPILWPAARAAIAWAVPGTAPVPDPPKPRLEWAPDGWATSLADGDHGWDSVAVTEVEAARWDAFCRNAAAAGPLGFSHEAADPSVVRRVGHHNVHMSFAYALALAAAGRTRLSVLDWGGALGHYAVIARALYPDLAVDYACRELPRMVSLGQRLNPGISWHVDDQCLARTYDLVMVNGSLQYIQDWRDFLARAAAAVGSGQYFLLTRVPVVSGTGFVAIQRLYGREVLHQQLNETELLDRVRDTGLHLVRELVVGDRPVIVNAPEQCELKGWLFTRPRG